MKLIATFLVILISIPGFSQQPLNYGRNKHFYFIAPGEADSFGLDSLIEVAHLKKGSEGGMNENWDVSYYSFGFRTYSYDWSIAELGDTFHYQFDSLLELAHYVNGEYSDGDGSGGGGYGTFLNSEIVASNDTCEISAYYLTGHCASNCGVYAFSRLVYDTNRRLLRKIYYPDQEARNDSDEYSSNLDPDEISFTVTGFDSAMIGQKKETIYFLYDKAGRLVHLYENEPIPQSIYAETYFEAGGIFSDRMNVNNQGNLFYQIYSRSVPIEKIIHKKIGYYPQMIIIGINDYGAVTLVRDKKTHKYYLSPIMQADWCSD